MSSSTASTGDYVNNLGLRCQYNAVVANPYSEDPGVGLWNGIFSREWDGDDGRMYIPQLRLDDGSRPDGAFVKWAADGLTFVFKAVHEAKPMIQTQQQDNESDGQLLRYAISALDSARANANPQLFVFAIKTVGNKFMTYKVWDHDRRLLAQDWDFRFPGDAQFQGNGDFQDAITHWRQIRGLFRLLRTTRMTK